jgi:hypothetical protein
MIISIALLFILVFYLPLNGFADWTEIFLFSPFVLDYYGTSTFMPLRRTNGRDAKRYFIHT